jgi:hypothetical protein
MALLFRILRARPGQEGLLLDWLQHHASRVGQDAETPLLVCRTDDPGEFVWVGHQPGEARRSLRPAMLVDSLAEAPLGSAPAMVLRFVGGWHRLPAPPYQIWNVEVRVPGDPAVGSVTQLFAPPGATGPDPLVGRSVFRAMEDPSVFVGFVALTWAWTRQHPVPRRLESPGGPVAVWRPLSTIYRAEAVRGSVDERPFGMLWTGGASAPAPSASLPA